MKYRPGYPRIFKTVETARTYIRDYVLGASGKAIRLEPWSIVLTDLYTGRILDVIDGRRGAAVTTWMAQRSEAWKRNIEYVSIDMSAEFRKAIYESLPEAKISVDAFHIVQRTHQMLTAVRQRRAHDLHGRRRRNIEPAHE